MLNETEAAASFHGLCHFFGRLSKAAQAGMKAALRGLLGIRKTVFEK